MLAVSVPIEVQKRVLRARLRALRLEESKINFGFDNKLRDIFQLNIKLEPGLIIGSYIAFNGEIDLAPLMETLSQSGYKIALPRIGGKSTPLDFHLYRAGDRLTQNPFGMNEPLLDAPLVEPDILLVPLLGFDAARNRLGYGGGYYDRTIAALRHRKSVLAIGIGYSFQQIAHVPTDTHDIKMDKIVTERAVF